MSDNNYIVSARKYRPSTFASVVGQQSLTHTLKTAIASGRLAHAYLFCGPRGVGKTTCARIFAKTINCEHPTPDGEACNECASCQAFATQQSYNITELDAASNNSVEDIRNITDQVRIPPQGGRYRVFIIDEVHMLSNQAFNAFLKTLEEPPEYAIFILATTEKQKVIPTILSRCQIYDFARITVPDIVAQLQRIAADQGVEAAPEALNVIAQKADGAMRDALSIFDQVVASTEGHITYQNTIANLNVLDYDYYFRLVDTFVAGDVPQALLIYKEVRDKGFDSLFFINGLAAHLRNLMVSQTPATRVLLEMDEQVSARYVEQAAAVSAGFLYRAVDLCCTCDLNYREATSKQLLVELTLVKLCQILKPQEAKREATPIQPVAAAPQPTAPQPAAAQTAAAPVRQSVARTVAPQPSAAAPAPAAPQPAAPQPAAPQPRSAASRRRPVAAGQSAAGAAATQSAPAAQGDTVRREPFTDDQLAAAWQDYIKAHPSEHVIISAMQMATPVKIGDNQYSVAVANVMQQNFMNDSKHKWLSSLRDALRNDMLAIDVTVAESAPEPAILSPRELANDMAQRLPQFRALVDDFGLRLS